MHLSAALVPPRDILDRVIDLAASVEPAWMPEDGSRGRHATSAGRRFGRRRQDASPPRPSGPLLDLVPPFQMHVPIAKFGNLALSDVTRLSEDMEAQALTWESPRLHLHGGVARDPKGDDSVWVALAGDLDSLGALTRSVARNAQGLHLFVDRRVFRPHLRLGTINTRTTEEYLAALLAALEAFESPAWWQTSVALLVPADEGPGRPTFKVYRDLKLGPAVPH
jgi:2'-5' RNA ligase